MDERSSKAQHSNTAVNVKALQKLIGFCGGQLLDDRNDTTASFDYVLVGERKGEGGSRKPQAAAAAASASNRLQLEGFLSIAAGEDDSEVATGAGGEASGGSKRRRSVVTAAAAAAPSGSNKRSRR
jgi:hypothetical protein